MFKGLIPLALLAANPAFATTIILTQVDSTLGQTIAFYDYGNNATNWVGGVDATVAGYSRVLYCVQLSVNIHVPGTYDSVLDFADAVNMQRVSWLMQYHAPTTPVTGAGFQLALWDILQDGADGFSAGNVRAATSGPATPDDVLTAAQNYETISAGNSSTAAILYNNFLNGVPQQELIGFWVTDGGPSAAPEPAAIFLMIGGLALIGLGRLRLGSRG